MAATFIIDTPAIFLLGLFLSLFALEGRGARPFPAVFPFGRGLLMTAIGFLIALGSYAEAPAWMSMYYLEDPARVGPRALAYMALALYAAPYALGFALGLDLRRRSRTRLVVAMALAAALQAAVMSSTWDRYAVVGTRAEWEAGTAIPLTDHAGITRISLAGGLSLALLFASVLVGWRSRRRAWRKGELGPPRYLNEREEEIVAAFARRLFPADATAADLGRELSLYIGHMVFAYRAGLRLAIFAAEALPGVAIGRLRPMTSLTDKERDRYLAALEHHRRDELRQIFVILKTTLCLLYYERPAVLQAAGMDFHCRQESRPPAFPETPRRAGAPPTQEAMP